MMSFCVRFGGGIVTRVDGPATALLRRALGYSAASGSLFWCPSSLSLGHRKTAGWKISSPVPGGVDAVQGRGVPLMQPAVSSQLVHTSAQWCMDDPTAVADNRHVELTAGAARENLLVRATVTRVWQASSSVLCFRLNVDHPDFQFKAGQWVDVHIAGMETVGGFSMCSAPHQFAADGSITLGIKRSEWPPVKWFHQNCSVGDTVELRVGGDFFLDLEGSPDPLPRLLLVGGGVGVNPLLSMMHHLDHLSNRRPHATLLYSARTEQDLLYKRELEELCHRNPNLKVQYFVRPGTPASRGRTTASQYHRGRIGRPHLIEALRVLATDASQTHGQAVVAVDGAPTTPGSSSSHESQAAVSFANPRSQTLASESSLPTKEVLKNVKVCICGPPAMINDVVEMLLEVGVSEDNLLYEKWW